MSEQSSQKLSLTKILNGTSIAIAITLVPGALMGELLLFIGKYHPAALEVLNMVNMCARFLPLAIGLCIAQLHKLDAIQSLAVGFAATIGSGVIVSVERGVYAFAGTGDVITATATAALAVFLILTFCTRLQSLSVIVTPTFVPIIAGSVGLLILPPISMITTSIGSTINYFTTLQPVLMGALIAMAFTIIIVSPISTVAIAYSIGISGIAASAANTGVAVASVVLALLSSRSNPIGTVIAHIVGTPKMQMANFIKKPTMILPCVLVSGVLGMITGIFGFEMTTQAAGFGIVGGIGPVALMNHLGWSISSTLIMISYFVLIPLGMGIALRHAGNKTAIISDEDYKLNY